MNTWVSTSQVLDVTKASHCTGSVSSALASGDAGERTQIRTVENKEEFTEHQQEPPAGEKSGPTAGRKEQPLRERADPQLVRRA